MLFTLSKAEVIQLAVAHIETEYGRKVDTACFRFDVHKSAREDVVLELRDNGPMPEETPAPASLQKDQDAPLK